MTSKRSFLKTVLAVGLFVICRPWQLNAASTISNPGRAADEAARRLARLISDPTTAIGLGKRLQQGYTGKVDPTEVYRQIVGALGVDPSRADQRTLSRAVRARRQLDLDRHLNVVVDGWVLAKCEAQICTLLALSNAGQE